MCLDHRQLGASGSIDLDTDLGLGTDKLTEGLVGHNNVHITRVLRHFLTIVLLISR
jgi:hypothetical protein